VLLVLAIGAANLAFHAAAAGAGDYSPARALWLAADVVLLIMAVVAGRVIPMFTNNAVAGAGARRLPAIEYAALASLVALALADLGALHPWTGVVAGAAALVHAVRLALWAPLATRRVPLLWILHLSYAWVVVHLVLRAAADFGLVTPSVAMHALAVGGIGGLTLGMMTRSALGHTGRPLVAGRPEILAYVLVQLSAVARVLVPLAAPGVYLQSVGASGLLWSLAFVVFTLAYAPMLTRPRIDGRPG
jgi:uncharacterized protein involved in response to NO